MKKIRGFSLKHRVTSLFRCLRPKTHSSAAGYRRLNPSPTSVSRLLSWGARLKTKAVGLCYRKPGYLPIGKDPAPPQTAVPKGKMAVYVGQKGGDFERVLVPVIYVNHPLFGELLTKAEAEYGHHHGGGGITIPCQVSEFEKVKTRIAAGCGGRKLLTWRRPM